MAATDRTTVPAPGVHLPLGLRRFFRTEQVGAAVLLAATVVAIVAANSPWKESYGSLWATEVSVRVGSTVWRADVRHVVNELLMTLFFFLAGLEIKRELVAGELRSWKRAALPAFAALGGMVVPAALYLLINRTGLGARGWGVPMATDIAFAVGVFALVGSKVPSSLKVFLLSLAIVDDIGAILVIAVFYAGSVDLGPLAVAAGLVVLVALTRRAGVHWTPAYLVLGVGLWLAVSASGVHATVAGVVLGLLAPASPLAPAAVAREWTSDLSDEPGAEEMRAMARLARSTVSAAERLQHALHPVVSFVVLPLFALANAGITLTGDVLAGPAAGNVAAGVVIGLVVGKAVGITAFAALATRLGLGSLPSGATWLHMLGVGLIAGIGFTMSLFVAEVAFEGGGVESAAKLGILVASVIASLGGIVVLRTSGRTVAGRPR